MILIILAIVIVGLFIAFRNSQSSSEEDQITPTIEVQEEEPTPEPTLEEDATPTPTKKVTPTPKATPAQVKAATDMRIQVLNGSGEVGAAGQAAAHLKSKGYEFVETGNADDQEQEGVIVQVKASNSKYLNELLADVKEKYSSATAGNTLSSDSDFDAVVTIGK